MWKLFTQQSPPELEEGKMIICRRRTNELEPWLYCDESEDDPRSWEQLVKDHDYIAWMLVDDLDLHRVPTIEDLIKGPIDCEVFVDGDWRPGKLRAIDTEPKSAFMYFVDYQVKPNGNSSKWVDQCRVAKKQCAGLAWPYHIAPQWANWVAQDNDGSWWFYSNKPALYTKEKVWGLCEPREPREQDDQTLKAVGWKGHTGIDWKDSLIARPQ